MPVARFTSAFADVNAFTTLTQPPRQAQWRGVQPMPLALFTSAPVDTQTHTNRGRLCPIERLGTLDKRWHVTHGMIIDNGL